MEFVRLPGVVPIILPLILIALGSLAGSARTRLVGWAVGQAEIVGAVIAVAYKAVTGRAHPTRFVGENLSRVFRERVNARGMSARHP